ncbi:MAG: DUF4239 domain-containing protein [Alphaproteobacteria bacterium]|nr:DUF4239 domain-containing protein [Alphaproteobacteria bacterium]
MIFETPEGVLAWLAQRPTWIIASLLFGLGILFTLGGVLLTNAYLTPQRLIANNAVASFKFAFVAEIFAGLMAFLLVGAGDRHFTANSQVFSEVAMLDGLRVVVDVMPEVERRPFEQALSEYALAVAGSEWESMSRGEESPFAAHAFEAMLAQWFALAPSTPQENSAVLLGNQMIAVAAEARVARLNNNVSQAVASLSWFTLLGLAAATIAFNWFFGTGSLRSQLGMALVLSVGIMTCTVLAFLLSFPFAGERAIDPAPFMALAT